VFIEGEEGIHEVSAENRTLTIFKCFQSSQSVSFERKNFLGMWTRLFNNREGEGAIKNEICRIAFI